MAQQITATLARILLAVLLCLGCDKSSNPVGPKPRGPHAITIKYDGTGDFPTIQAGINATIDGDTVVLENGRFKGAGNRDLDFHSRKVILRSAKNDPVHCVIDCEGDVVEPHRGFVFQSGETPASVIEGVGIENGYGLGGGGAILCENQSSPLLRNVILRASDNRALMCRASSPSFESCIFFGNFDGAAYVSSNSAVTFRQCEFRSNVSDDAGGGIAVISSTVDLIDCVFELNTSFSSGGGIECISISDVGRSRLTALRCTFISNSADPYGGGINVRDSEFDIDACAFVGNNAPKGAGISSIGKANGTLRGTTFYGNASGEGAAFFCGSCDVDLRESILAFNSLGASVACDTLFGPVTLVVECSDIFGNDGGDWVTCVAAWAGSSGNISSDPLFCAAQDGVLSLNNQSPCAPANSACGLMGAFLVGCPTTQLDALIHKKRSPPITRPRGTATDVIFRLRLTN